MLGAVYKGKGILQVEEVPLREPGPDEVLVRVDSATICGTDLHILAGEYFANAPVILGHEFSGTVERTGGGVGNCRPGDLVCIEPHTFCNTCRFCRIGKPHMCTDKLAYGVHLNGGFAQYAVLPKHTLYAVPEGVTAEEAALAENVSCCIHGIDKADVKFGDTVVILGGGVVGMILSQLCKLRGAAKVIVSEPIEHRRGILLSRGADIVVNPFTESLIEIVNAATSGLGADLVIESAGRAETSQQTFGLVARGGTIMFFGVVPPGKTVTVEPNFIYAKEITIIGSAINPFVYQRTVEMLKILKVRELITHTFKLTEIDEAFEAARQGIGLKVCIKPNM
jgi:2-desacetyl-2-hydroxyethyl bacteriochlorophyllide A dehydrogenase